MGRCEGRGFSGVRQLAMHSPNGRQEAEYVECQEDHCAYHVCQCLDWPNCSWSGCEDEALQCTKQVLALSGYLDDAVQVCQGLVNGRLCIKRLGKELVLQDRFQALLQTVGLLL